MSTVASGPKRSGGQAVMPGVELRGVSHSFGDVGVLHDVSLEVAPGEFLTLLGPSGCGKTTLLRIVAGFERPRSGTVVLSGQDVTALQPDKRPTNMVFQRPTLFPHLDVYGNVAFGLQVAGVPRDEQRERIAEALALVRLEGYERRRSDELSGGQMQRVALARALVKRPSVLLLDEPLSALDLKIRLEMEAELRRVHRETAATFVYVTHDQREAMALSDRIVVMNEGRVEQVGPPDEVYREPASMFVARFVGDANVIGVQVLEHSARKGVKVKVGGSERTLACRAQPPGPALLVLRPEVVEVTAGRPSAGGGLGGRVQDVAFRGTGIGYRIEVSGLDEPIKAEVPAAGAEVLAIGSEVMLDWEEGACTLLPSP